MHRLVLIVLTLFSGAAAFAQAPGQVLPSAARTNAPARVARPQFKLEDGDRVVFLGDTFIERELLESYIETMLTLRFPDKKVIFRNLGWSADTPLGESRAGFDAPEKGFDRLKEHLAAVKPTVVFMSHGMSSSFNGKEGLLKFDEDMQKLVAAIEEICGPTVRLVFLGPIRHEHLPPPLPDPGAHNELIDLYNEALRKIAADKKAVFVNLYHAFNTIANPANPVHWTDNGIHPTALGYWRISALVNLGLGIPSLGWRLGVSPTGDARTGSTVSITNFVKTAEGFTFEAISTQHVYPPAPERPDEFRRFGGQFGMWNLQPGDYVMRMNGVPITVAAADEWGQGPHFNTGPLFDHVEEIRELVKKKNELYFHRWRPQNETYLFGFRKYEQGQNAREIPMFDPLITELEEKIRALAAPRPVKVEVARATDDDRARAGKSTRKVAAKPAEAPAAPTREQALPVFQTDPAIEVTLFAENPDLAKPIHMNFDPEGRLWIASSSVYPQIQPGQTANDKILVLEDTDGDGKADKSTVFADGLLIPTGVAPGDGGVYVANSTELLFFKDTDRDGKADTKRVVLSGFGTEDTHHILHTLRWGFDGQLYMNQSIYIHSHVETPHGVMRLNSGGIWNLRPPTMELGIHMKGLVNSWGHHYDRWGQSFATDGASGGDGINWVIPQAMYFTYAGARRIVPSISPGSYPKFASLEIIDSEHFPADWQGTLVTCDFRAHRVVRFAISEKDSAYVTKELPEVMRTTNVTFRPIDVKVGPDGALYIADWSNPIIQHGEVDFRDPRRDHEHGRIWRVTAKGRSLAARPDFKKQTVPKILESVLSPNTFVRESARRVLTELDKVIVPDLEKWTQAQKTEQGLLEALWLYQSIDYTNAPLLEKVLAAKDGRVRAAGTRVLSFWRNRVPNRDELLARLIADEHPRVRVEAMRALAKVPVLKSAELILAATDKPMDKYLDYAAWLSINDLAEIWVNGIRSGAWKPDGKEKQLAFGLNAIVPNLAAAALPAVLPAGELPRDGSGPWLDLIGKSGGARELERLFNQAVGGGFENDAAGRAYAALADAARTRNARPEGDLAALEKALAAPDSGARTEAIRLAGAWKLGTLSPKLLEAARSKDSPANVRRAAIQSLRDIGGGDAVKGLTELAGSNSDLSVRQPAVVTLAALDLKQAAPLAIEVLSATTDENEALNLWRQLLAIKGAAAVFTHALPKAGLPPVMARTGLRVAREGGRNEPNLVLALARSIETEEESKNLTPRELEELVTSVTKYGDAARGEIIYRRQELACVACHAIGGAGGKVGPDLTSIGASAQVDYLVESLQFPNRKIKEGFHSTLIETKDGEELSGIVVRETEDQVVIRDASNREVAVPKNSIARRGATGSLMPAGLVDALSSAEQADLYRFLSELGKPGPYDASKGDVARFFKVLSATIDLAQFGDERVVQRDLNDSAWTPAFTLVDGSLLRAEIERSIRRVGGRSVPAVYAAAQFTSAKDGNVRLKIENVTPLAVYIDGKPVQNPAEPNADLKTGPHTVIIKLDATKLPDSWRLRSSDVTFATQ